MLSIPFKIPNLRGIPKPLTILRSFAGIPPSARIPKNEEIKFPSMRVVYTDADTKKNAWKIMDRLSALKFAKQLELDLVLLNSSEKPPVCRIEHYGRRLMEQKEKEKQVRANLRKQTVKEMIIMIGIDPHDLEIKMKKVRAFIVDGHPVKITVMLRKNTTVQRAMEAKRQKKSNDGPPVISILHPDALVDAMLAFVADLPIAIQEHAGYISVAKPLTGAALIAMQKNNSYNSRTAPEMIRVLAKKEFILTPRKLMLANYQENKGTKPNNEQQPKQQQQRSSSASSPSPSGQASNNNNTMRPNDS